MVGACIFQFCLFRSTGKLVLHAELQFDTETLFAMVILANSITPARCPQTPCTFHICHLIISLSSTSSHLSTFFRNCPKPTFFLWNPSFKCPVVFFFFFSFSFELSVSNYLYHLPFFTSFSMRSCYFCWDV